MGNRATEQKTISGFLAGDNEEYATVKGWVSSVLDLPSWHYTVKAAKDDISQDVMIILTENFRNDKYQWRGLRTYVSTITKFRCLKVYDKNHNIESLEIEPVSEDPTAIDELIDSERWTLLGRVVEELDYNCRKMLVLRYYKCMRHNAIANRLKTTVSTSRQWLKRCLDKARNLVQEMENL